MIWSPGRSRGGCVRCQQSHSLQLAVKILYGFVAFLIITVAVLASLGELDTEVFLMQRLVGRIQPCDLFNKNMLYALKWVKSTSDFSTYILVAWIVHSPNSHRSSECVPGFCCPCFTWQLLSTSRCFLHQHHFLLCLKAVNLYGLQLFRDIRGQSEARTDSKSLNTQKAAFRYTS